MPENEDPFEIHEEFNHLDDVDYEVFPMLNRNHVAIIRGFHNAKNFIAEETYVLREMIYYKIPNSDISPVTFQLDASDGSRGRCIFSYFKGLTFKKTGWVMLRVKQ